jgi:altronate dehydratase
VSSACNPILFTTRHASITNFPFVPTIKIMTTNRRFQLLSKEMDVNAGRYLEGESMDALGAETFELARQIASGRRSAGERAGHSQVQIWREWRQTQQSTPEPTSRKPEPNGIPISLEPAPRQPLENTLQIRFPVFQTAHGPAIEQIGLIVPTSLCSGQIARLIADRLNRGISDTKNPNEQRIQRYVALAHTEGCGVSRGSSEELYVRTIVGYLCHPHTRRGLLLEHGCEKTHNDLMRHYLDQHGVDSNRFGWASVQLDGGIERVTDKVMRWFHSACSEEPQPSSGEAGWDVLRLGLTAVGPIHRNLAAGVAKWVRRIIESGGTVVLAENTTLFGPDGFQSELTGSNPAKWTPTLAYGQGITQPGLHIMEMPTDHPVETLTGLGAAGVNLLLALVNGPPLPAHPMVPLVQVGQSSSAATAGEPGNAQTDFDFVLDESQSPERVARKLGSLIQRVLSQAYTPKSLALGNTDFQMTRGLVGVSL